MGCRRLSIWRSTAIASALALLVSACASSPESGWTPVQFSLYSPVQLFSPATAVRGWRVGFLYAENDHVYGLDWGAVGYAKSMAGLQLNSIRNVADALAGVQLGPLGNESDRRARGVQLAGVVNLADDVAGVQIAGIHNRARRVAGVQIGGIVNDVGGLVGLQIGLLNFNESGPLRFFPFFNFGFGDAVEEPETSED